MYVFLCYEGGKVLLTDTHVHSNFSTDGVNSIEDIIRAAIALNMPVLTFTEHADVNEVLNPMLEVRKLLNEYKAVFPQLKEKYAGQIELLAGIELGQPYYDILYTENMLKAEDLDFVLCSLHVGKGFGDYYDMKYDRVDVLALLDSYFFELLEIVSWGQFDSLAHITYPLRYIVGREGLSVELSDYAAAIDKVLKKLIDSGIAMEVNTSGLSMPYYERPDPWYEIIERYYALGGRLLTLGSDAHEASCLRAGFDDVIPRLRAIGFGKLVYYKQRKPVFYDI
jgi:histidinol-phosphatase (PHP family)